MNLVERQRQFLDAAQRYFGTSKAVRPRELFGVSNSAKIVEGGIQLGVVNLDNVKEDAEALIFGCVLRFPPEDEVYFAVLIRKDRASFLARLAEMKRLGLPPKQQLLRQRRIPSSPSSRRAKRTTPANRPEAPSNTVPATILSLCTWRGTAVSGCVTPSSGTA